MTQPAMDSMHEGSDAPYLVGKIKQPMKPFLAAARAAPASPSLTFDSQGGLTASNYDRRHSKSFSTAGPVFAPLYAEMDQICRDEAHKLWTIGTDVTLAAAGEDQGLRYDEGDYFGEHWDSGIWRNGARWENRHQRRIAVVVYLNGNYEGGELVLNGAPHKFAAGEFVLFGADHRYPHEVLKVTKGERFCVTRWWSYYLFPKE
jgi:hypothetical protein